MVEQILTRKTDYQFSYPTEVVSIKFGLIQKISFWYQIGLEFRKCANRILSVVSQNKHNSTMVQNIISLCRSL